MGFAMRTRTDASPPVSIGIDLGTCYSRVGVWRDGDVLVIPNERGRLATPSVIAFTENCVLIGEAAREQAEENLENTIFAPQRLIGSKFENPWVQWYMKTWPSKLVRGENDRPMIRVRERGRDRLMPPEEMVTLLVEHLRRTAERYLGAMAVEAVITVPAQFGQHQRRALMQACRDARLKVLALLKCPTAAAIAFSHTNPVPSRQNLLVCDMGSSYFDFSLLSVEDGVIAERAVGTDYVDLDGVLLRFCVRDLKERYCIDVAGLQEPQQRLRVACELAKRRLSQFNHACIEVPSVAKGTDYAVSISRGHFEDVCRCDVDALLDPIDWCLEDCGLSREDVDVVLVGGCARVPQVRRSVRSFFYGRPPQEVIRPDHAAVLGAAVYVALLAGSDGRALAKGLRPMHVRQVAPWCTSMEGDVDIGGPDDENSTGDPSRPSNSVTSSDELEPAPCNEAVGCPRPPRIRVSRPASARYFRQCPQARDGDMTGL